MRYLLSLRFPPPLFSLFSEYFCFSELFLGHSKCRQKHADIFGSAEALLIDHLTSRLSPARSPVASYLTDIWQMFHLSMLKMSARLEHVGSLLISLCADATPLLLTGRKEDVWDLLQSRLLRLKVWRPGRAGVCVQGAGHHQAGRDLPPAGGEGGGAAGSGTPPAGGLWS